MSDKRRPDSDDESETIPPDIATSRETPLSPSEAVKREQEKYGETSLDENRGDQWDEHHGEPDDIV